ncbi:MAG TPA: phosphotransferase [Spirochaetia bacterium]|nr:phosphotransferase [Spirochaetia bacterium]
MYKKQLSSIEISFYSLLKNNSNFDFVLFPEKIENEVGYFPLLESGNLLGKDKKYYVLAMQAIAKFHHFIKTQPLPFVEIDEDYYARSLKNTLDYAVDQNVELPTKQINELQDSFKLIGDKFQLIHDDFLPQNVVVDHDEVKIIDWEDMKYGFAEHDIGRFLGDLDAKNPQWDKKYYPQQWHDSLIDTYVQNRQRLDPSYDVDIGKQQILLGEMWNYLGPIEMCLNRGEINSNWFLANIKALENS